MSQNTLVLAKFRRFHEWKMALLAEMSLLLEELVVGLPHIFTSSHVPNDP